MVIDACERPRGSVRQSPPLLAATTVGVGLLAHVLGGGAAVECLPLLLAAALGVTATLVAQRALGHFYRGTPAAVLVLGAGQFAMHLALRGHEAAAQATDDFLGLNCSLTIAHAIGTALLAMLLLGAHQSVELAVHLLARMGRRITLFVALPPRSALDRKPQAPATVPARTRETGRGQQWQSGLTRPRRGPPAFPN